MDRAYYSEIEPYAAAWLRNLIAEGHIPAGDVDERDIRDVRPDDLRGYTQCHFFAGLGGWAYALRLAGWPDDRPVWTGSCPCQPFSAAGRGAGFADERHLWPHLYYLVGQRRPRRVFGEQVASKDGLAWLDLVQADLEGAGYAFAASDLCAAGVGAPHIRQRLWWVAEDELADGSESGWCEQPERADRAHWRAASEPGRLRPSSLLADAMHPGRPQRRPESGDGSAAGSSGPVGLGAPGAEGLPARQRAALVGAGRGQEGRAVEQPGGASGGVGLTDGDGRQSWRAASEIARHGSPVEPASGGDRPGPVNGFWRDADWLLCRDGKWRPTKSGIFPLVDGTAFKLGSGSPLEGKSRVGMLRAAGNAIVPQVAAEFIGAYLDAEIFG